MTSVDKAAIGWSIAIVAVGVAIAGAGMSGGIPETALPSPTVTPSMEEQARTDPFADIAQETMSQAEEREKAIAEQMGGSMMEEKVSVTAPKVEDVPQMAGPTTVEVSMPEGTSVPGCEETNECYLPPSITINVGDTVSWDNVDTAAHTVTSGTPADGPDGKFDSSLLMGGAQFEVTFDEAGSYDYFCMVHPWMVGDVQVN